MTNGVFDVNATVKTGLLKSVILNETTQTLKIEIEEGVWLASKSTVLKGVSIGKFSVIAASAVLTQSVPDFEVWGGIPAKFIKKITTKNLALSGEVL